MILLAFILLIILSNAIKIAKEYERGVIFRLGRLKGTKGPGIFVILPIVDQVFRVDLRTIVLDVPFKDVTTKNKVPVRGKAVVSFRVADPEKALTNAQNFIAATQEASQMALRNVVSEVSADRLFDERLLMSEEMQEIIAKAARPWGIEVSKVELEDMEYG